MGKSAKGFCPLFTNTSGYIGFFETYGQLAFHPMGILDPHSPVYEQFTNLNLE